jgi:hypothetical protein
MFQAEASPNREGTRLARVNSTEDRMGDDQEIDTAGTEADDESATAKREGFGEHSRPPRKQNETEQPADDERAKTTIPDEPGAGGDPTRGAGVRDTGDKGGVS